MMRSQSALTTCQLRIIVQSTSELVVEKDSISWVSPQYMLAREEEIAVPLSSIICTVATSPVSKVPLNEYDTG